MRRIWVSILIMAVTLALALGNGWYLQRLTGGMALELKTHRFWPKKAIWTAPGN